MGATPAGVETGPGRILCSGECDAMKLQFTKMHGAGNDYIYLDCRHGEMPPHPEQLARELSRRHFSVGADGLICIAPPQLADGDAAMVMYNADGSEGAMCGNGIRCVAEYLYTHGLQKDRVELDTARAGRKTLYRVAPHRWRAGMGRFSTWAADLPAVGLGNGPLLDVPLVAAGRSWRVNCLSMGNPHCVVLCREAPPTGVQLAEWGNALQQHPAFPRSINVEFVRADGPAALTATVWERGSGATLACGTGACAAVAVLVLRGNCQRNVPVSVTLPGGTLEVCVLEDDTVLLTGCAQTVFEGTLEI